MIAGEPHHTQDTHTTPSIPQTLDRHKTPLISHSLKLTRLAPHTQELSHANTPVSQKQMHSPHTQTLKQNSCPFYILKSHYVLSPIISLGHMSLNCSSNWYICQLAHWNKLISLYTSDQSSFTLPQEVVITFLVPKFLLRCFHHACLIYATRSILAQRWKVHWFSNLQYHDLLHMCRTQASYHSVTFG